MAKEKSFTFPKSLATCADKLFTIRAQRYDLQHQADAIEEEEKALKAHIIKNLPLSKATGIAGKLCSVTLETKSVPAVEDWGSFYKYIKKHNAFDLLQRRVNEKAVQARWDDKQEVPGVGTITVNTLSISKV
jgi:hypothetical protein